jgi:GTP-binding protein of the ras superfamily involved in termination of M-phase
MELHSEQGDSQGAPQPPQPPQPLEGQPLETPSFVTDSTEQQPMTVTSDVHTPMMITDMQQPPITRDETPIEAIPPPTFSNEAMPAPMSNEAMLPQVPQYHEPVQAPVSDNYEAQKHMDQTMDVDDSNNTITAASVQPMPSFHPNNNNIYAQNNNGYAQNSTSPAPEPYRPSTSYSDTAYQYTGHNGSRFNSSDADTPPRHGYYDAGKETHMGQSHSRPNSQMGRYPVSEGATRANSYQDQSRSSQQQQATPPEAANKNASVVIKVGMVGDAQIGKTSLMVKYVEGSWDEDYIQTLGME